MPELAIVIVSFNARDDLARCLASLHASPPAVSHEIVLVDNASTDGGPAMVRERWPAVRVIETGKNLGFSAGNNVGIRASASELILLLNGDTLVPPGAIDRLVAELRHCPDAAVIGPRLRDGAGRTELSWGPMIGPFSEARQKLLGKLYERGVGPVCRYVERLAATARTTDWVSGACLLVRRADAVAVGLLDERYFLYTEDVDFCAAIRSAGRTVRYTPAAEVVHLRGRSRAHAPATANAAYRRSHLAFYRKHHPAWAPILRAYLAIRRQLPPPLPTAEGRSPERNVEER
jgi:GT2 family glycosyltransferase